MENQNQEESKEKQLLREALTELTVTKERLKVAEARLKVFDDIMFIMESCHHRNSYQNGPRSVTQDIMDYLLTPKTQPEPGNIEKNTL